MIINRNNCIYCKSKIKNILQLKEFPIKFSCSHEIENYKKKTLSFGFCESCKVIQLDKLIELNILYDTPHNMKIIGSLWKNLYTFIKKIISPTVENANVLEIGCPSGKILKTQDKYKLWYIIDPNVINIEKKNVITINKFFDNNIKIKEKIDLIVHSHLFEHIYDPLDFLKTCYNILNENGKMIFAIPNMQNNLINDISPFGGLHFEHTIFYTKKNVVKYLEESNFEVLKIYDYEKHSIIFETKKTTKIKNKYKIEDNIDYLEKFNLNVINYKDFATYCLNLLKKEKRYIYIFGASIYSSVLLYLGLDKLNISGILDNSKEKENKYLYGFEVKIYNPSILKEQDAIVILRNGIYSEEIKKQIMSINNKTIVIY
tara:strand:+ start:7139 stop:8257 length:1119 start_codon:yes stop_codon:yes gene_type:complete